MKWKTTRRWWAERAAVNMRILIEKPTHSDDRLAHFIRPIFRNRQFSVNNWFHTSLNWVEIYNRLRRDFSEHRLQPQLDHKKTQFTLKNNRYLKPFDNYFMDINWNEWHPNRYKISPCKQKPRIRNQGERALLCKLKKNKKKINKPYNVRNDTVDRLQCLLKFYGHWALRVPREDEFSADQNEPKPVKQTNFLALWMWRTV